ncbi:MAG: DUF4013 domain-containing protein [Methanoregula sp.]
MDFGNMLRDSYAYAKGGTVENKSKWLMLIIATILLELPLMGYLMKVLRAEKPAPEVQDWGTLFSDGIKFLIVGIIYYIPLFIVYAIAIAIVGASAFSGDPNVVMGAMAGAGLLGLIAIILCIIIGLILPIAAVRFARTGSIGEAFNFRAIFGHIGKIGWISYIIALIIVAIVIAIPVAIIEFILMALMIGLAMIVAELSLLVLLLAAVIYLALMPLIAVFMARYITQIYDSVG